ncbi:unnamed protein product [Fraxinus pennsylvanica]|uniref:CCHC-type domain-containing protein n=1 Tax=Fraxinus pennsylvanica TaxID=56036 RepID=A0AAD1ZP44_9LAMI|nr:unnamed protein product [Fraxinus pennsylvanica]
MAQLQGSLDRLHEVKNIKEDILQAIKEEGHLTRSVLSKRHCSCQEEIQGLKELIKDIPTGPKIFQPTKWEAPWKDLIEEWNGANSFILNTQSWQNDSTSVDNFIKSRLSGSVLYWYNNTKPEKKTILWQQQEGSGVKFFNAITEEIFRQFAGIERSEAGYSEYLEEQAKNLEKIRLCDIYYFNKYACQYKHFYFRIPEEERKPWEDRFYRKIDSIYWREKFREKWNDGIDGIPDNLGGRIRLAKDLLREACRKRKDKKELKGRGRILYDQQDPSLAREWGCYVTPRRKTPKKHWKPKPNKRFYKKRPCPEGKPSNKCRRFICRKEGHVATNCPEKGKEKVNMVSPILYLSSSEDESSTQSSSSGSESETDQNNNLHNLKHMQITEGKEISAIAEDKNSQWNAFHYDDEEEVILFKGKQFTINAFHYDDDEEVILFKGKQFTINNQITKINM